MYIANAATTIRRVSIYMLADLILNKTRHLNSLILTQSLLPYSRIVHSLPNTSARLSATILLNSSPLKVLSLLQYFLLFSCKSVLYLFPFVPFMRLHMGLRRILRDGLYGGDKLDCSVAYANWNRDEVR